MNPGLCREQIRMCMKRMAGIILRHRNCTIWKENGTAILLVVKKRISGKSGVLFFGCRRQRGNSLGRTIYQKGVKKYGKVNDQQK